MSPLAWIIVGSFAIFAALILLAVVCACVLAGRADRVIEEHEYVDPFTEVEATVFDWPVMAPSARVIDFPRRNGAA